MSDTARLRHGSTSLSFPQRILTQLRFVVHLSSPTRLTLSLVFATPQHLLDSVRVVDAKRVGQAIDEYATIRNALGHPNAKRFGQALDNLRA